MQPAEDASPPHERRLKRIRILSCQRCRSRKSKCDTSLPCGPCSKEGMECIRITSDRRKERYSSDYTESLQRRVESLEKVLNQVRQVLEPGNTPSGNSITSPSVLGRESEPKINIRALGGNRESSTRRNFNGHNVSVYGPTSVFDSHLVDEVTNETHVEEILQLQKDALVIHCIKLFFKWQYPDHNSFVVREAFLLEFFTPVHNSLYCSTELVLAICALGSRMSTDEHISSKSWQYYHDAKSIVLSKLDKPSIATMQAFLLLSFFDISNGNNSSGWMLSGCGIRMGFDLGFQLDPTVWFLKSNGSLSALNIAIRSRIFWGCYFADHFIGLLLGRPSILKVCDSTVPETDYLPDLEWITEYTYLSPGADPSDKSTIINVSAPLKHLVRLINISSDMLNDVFTKDQRDTFDLTEKAKRSQHYNSIIMEWRNGLPVDLRWSRKSLEENAENPTKMIIPYYYYILLLCLNRPFLEAANSEKLEEVEAAAICNEVIEDLIIVIDRFSSVHGLEKASIFIVYCCILSVSVLLLSQLNKQPNESSLTKLQLLLTALYKCSNTWKLADKSFKLIQSQIEKLFMMELKIINSSVELSTKEYTDDPNDIKRVDISSILNSQRAQSNAGEDVIVSDNFELFGGPPLLMTSDLVNQDWDALFPDFMSKPY